MRILKDKKGTGLRPFSIGIVMILLFSFFIFAFVGNFIQATNPSAPILIDSRLTQSVINMQESISRLEPFSENLYRGDDTLGNPKPSAVEYIFLMFQGAFYIPLAFADFVYTGFKALINILLPTLSGTTAGTLITITMMVIFSVITITIVLLIVKTIRTGESER